MTLNGKTLFLSVEIEEVNIVQTAYYFERNVVANSHEIIHGAQKQSLWFHKSYIHKW